MKVDSGSAHDASSTSESTTLGQTRGPREEHRVSVVVLSKDEPDLAVTLDLLKPQCESLRAECVVVDASESRLDEIRVAHPWVNWIDYSGPFWRSSTIPHQRNVGCRAALGDIIVFCDAGGEPDDDWLESITAPLISGRYTLVCGPVVAKGVGVYSVINDFADGEVVPSAPSGNMAFLRSVFDLVDGFDERLYYGSDVDYTWRCAEAGHPCYQVRGAVMNMDFGNPSLTVRRSWRYGRAWARLYGLRPQRRFKMMKESPERVVYPLWILLGALSLLAATRRRLRWAPLAWLGILGLLYVRSRKYPSPRSVIADHIVGGVSVLNESARRLVGEMPPVVFIPHDETPYVRRLADAVRATGTPVASWGSPTPSATMNILLGPLRVIVLAWRGMKVLHIHWTYNFSKSSDAVFGRLARWWFGIFLSAAHAAGVKVVWTAHNVLPHEPVFDDDVAARKVLVDRADAVIAMSPHSADEVAEAFSVQDVTIIPHGPIELLGGSASRELARQELGLDHRTCFTYFGYLRPYKGVEVLIDAAERLGPKVTVLVAGHGDPAYVNTLEKLVTAAAARGADIRFAPRWHSDEELATVIAASDVSVFPFSRVDNSGSVILALASGVPVVVPDLASLRHVDSPGVFRYDHADPVNSLAAIMTELSTMDGAQRVALGDAAREWALAFDWSEIGRATNAVYAGTLREA